MEISKINRWSLEYIYMTVMVIYMGMMTINTASMVTYSPQMDTFAIILPVILNVALIVKHKINFSNKGLIRILCFCLVWLLCLFLKYDGGILKSSLILFYAILVAYIQVYVYRNKLFDFYEDIITIIAKISLVLWLFSLLYPTPAINFFHDFPRADYSSFGYNFLYIFNWMDISTGQYGRNAGCSWEPGRYAIMLSLGIAISVLKKGISIKNKKLIWLLLALITTFSTTGYIATIMILFIFYVKKVNFLYVLYSIIFIIPIYFIVVNVPFLADKISLQLSTLFNFDFYNELVTRTAEASNGEYTYSLERFPSMYFEWQNILNDPIIGYGRSPYYSYFYQNISSNVSLPSGILKVLSNYGLILGMFFYYILYKSSNIFGKFYHKNSPIMLCLLISSISYSIFTIPVFTSFWLYSYFIKNNDNECIYNNERAIS